MNISSTRMKSVELNQGESFYGDINAKRIILGFQHLIAMFGATVLVPILTGMPVAVALFCAGLGTIIFHLCTQLKVPAFLGSSFAFIPAIIQVREMYNGDLAYAQGGIIVAGLIYVIFSLFVQQIGVKRIQRILAPQVIGPMIIVIGMNLLPTAINMASNNYIIAAITLATAIIITRFTHGFIKQLGILIAVTVGYLISVSMNQVDLSILANAPIFEIPAFTMPKFDMGAIVVIAPIVLAVFMEHLGDITTNGQVVGKNFIENPGLNRTLLGDGLATAVAGFLGGPANTTYGENTAVLAITKNYDPSLLRIAATMAIIFAFIAKLGAVINSIPVAVMGGISVMLFSMISYVGVSTIKKAKVKFNWKNILIMASILIIGLFSNYIQTNFGITLGVKINEAVSLSGISFAALVGIALNIILNRKEN